MRLSVGHCGRISSSLSTCSWSSAKAKAISAFWIGNAISVATASWYKGTGTPPRTCAAQVAALEALFRKAAGERSYFVGVPLPAPGLPDAEILLPDSRPRAAHARVVHQQLRERVHRPGVRGHGAPSP